ncbi:hypothetical protein BX616_007020 [Lobosporangium transversale]|uniref:Uncharacterized protein n=1 Tax=Lobosporangium transversale TaxID=64571 RepID=A0A1Y2GKU8_9FUNG|nr:hypothetical protein BCR41DRAFT_388089 [Lobosporangium transversale]KAF9896645.1 hypothetical protein BX616_007020 [Lobosporangium transversale]ORZ10365.1 hypothetical protein BCR41DRAFT_388089 [Lobosporangium transversale]|eukprot:XP_021879272.1 hypothetical protein BCR41DRAFT_388089 [Lobosporangium transversale]
MAAPAMRPQGLSQFRRILREVHLQYTHPKELTGKGLHGINIHANKVWTEALKDVFRKHANETDPARLNKLYTDGEDMVIYLESQRKHKGLVERYNPSFWDEEKGIQVDKTARMVGFEMPEKFDESMKDKEWIPPPKFTFKNKAVGEAAATSTSDNYEELKAPEEPKKRTYQIPKAFGFAEQAEDDVGRAGDRKIK